MSNALRKIRRHPENLAKTVAFNKLRIMEEQKATVFLYKGNEKDHAICQFHIREIGAELAKKLSPELVGTLGTEAKLERISRTDLNCEVCYPLVSTEPILEEAAKEFTSES